MVREVWRAIAGWSYEVSTLGRVRNMDTRKIRKHYVGKDGYCRLVLYDRGRTQCFTVHTLVAQAHIGPRPAGLDINHLDSDKQNNAANNLEYTTRSKNLLHAFQNGRAKSGQDHPFSVLTNSKSQAIRDAHHAGETQAKIARRFGVSPGTVHYIIKGATWKHVADWNCNK